VNGSRAAPERDSKSPYPTSEKENVVPKGGFNHIGLATRDMDATKSFYEDVLGFTTVRYDRFDISEGGYLRHIFMDTGNGELISFLEPNEVAGIPSFDPGINEGLGVPNAFYHIAFEAGSVEELDRIREHLDASGVKVSPVFDHDWAKSIYFFDPVNKLSLEYCVLAREFTEDDRTYQYRFTGPAALLQVDIDAQIAVEESRWDTIGRVSERGR
jgi:catechol 2,3-dioxygenase-like lactoylglutathione lyase family enzyme